MKRDAKKIEKEVLKKITPNYKEREELENVIKELKNKTKEEIEKIKIPISIELVGSTAKDTFLKNNLDIDLFLLFPANISREKLEKVGLLIGETILKNKEECYAEHPYVRGIYKNYKTEIVPCYKIESSSQKLSAVDRTPLHTKYVKKHLLEIQKDEVRLLKQFLIGIDCYGAEAEIEGFSGYLCEILIMKYGTFQKLIEHAQNWKYGEKLYLSSGDYPDFDTPLIFIDPVDSKRNVASALSEEKFNFFKIACKEYLQHPRITFFFPNQTKPWSLDKIKKEIKKEKYIFVGVKIAKPDTIAENLYPQVRKAVRSIVGLCKNHGFLVNGAEFYIEEQNKVVYIIIRIKDNRISKRYIHIGPPVKLKKNTDNFLKRWKNDTRVIRKPYEKDGRLFVEIERKYTEIRHLLNEQIKNLSLGKNMNEMVKKGYDVLNLDDLLIPNLRFFWTKYLDSKKPWER